MKPYGIAFLLFIALLVNGHLTNTLARPAYLPQGEKSKKTQDGRPVIQSTVERVYYVEETKGSKNGWILAPEAKPDILNVGLIDGKPHRVTFYTDVDSISYMVELDKKYDFIIQWGDKMCYQQLVGTRFIPAAVFDDDYIREHKGRIIIQIPDVYELINVAIAMTNFGIEKKNFVYHDSDYYQKVIAWFDKYKDHPFITTLNDIFAKGSGRYASLKMNGNAFYFDEKGKIQRSRVYDRTAFRYMRENNLLPYLELMQSFADDSDFLAFYRQNTYTYQEQITVYRDSINLAEMINWLDRNFPAASNFDTYNIIFSPLVSYNQSTTWFESNGFRELQPHVNFPYRRDLIIRMALSKKAEFVFRGNIVFTELNHGYMNPEEIKYADRIAQAVSHRSAWVDSTAGDNYYGGSQVFSEYMNWGLISLRFVDYVSKSEQEKMIPVIERSMVKGRKFRKFKEFNQHLLELYKNRPEGSTVADLYPQIIAWFAENNY